MNKALGDERGYARLAPIGRPLTLRQQAYEAVAELIISGELGPGQHLIEAKLASRLGVSRQPVREALQALQGDGWVELRPGRGAHVHQPTPREVDQVFTVRAALESESARLAARNARPEDVERLIGICAEGRRSLSAENPDAVVAANAQLHREVTTLADNDVLARLTASLDRQVRWYFTPIARTRGSASWDEHEQLVDALGRHDEETAASVMRRHTERTRHVYHQTLECEAT